jgi:hypothetical protein
VAFHVCLFCFQERPLTREHLISKPIASALELDLHAAIGEFDNPLGLPDAAGIRFVDLGDMKVRSVCRDCNNGWLADLETDAAAAFRAWFERGRLARGGGSTISQWLATRLLIWTVRDGGGRGLPEAMNAGLPTAVPHFDRAKRLAAGTADALDGIAVGVARASGSVAYCFGNASTEPRGMAKALTAVLALRFPPLQLWVADSPLTTDIQLPRGVVALADGMKLDDLPERGNDLSCDQALARFTPELTVGLRTR